MIQVESPRAASVLGRDGENHTVMLDNPVPLNDAFRSAGIAFAPSMLKVGFGWEGNAMIDVAATFVKGQYFSPGRWEPCGEALSFGDSSVGSGVLRRCDQKELNDDIDCGVQYYLWGLPKEADGIVFALTLIPDQKTPSFADIGEIHMCIDADNCRHDEEGQSIFVPVMHVPCMTSAKTQTLIVAGMFVGSGLRYGLSSSGDHEGLRYIKNTNDGPRAGRLEPRALQITPSMTRPGERLPDGGHAERKPILQHLGLMV
jgi:hypothetical protein